MVSFTWNRISRLILKETGIWPILKNHHVSWISQEFLWHERAWRIYKQQWELGMEKAVEVLLGSSRKKHGLKLKQWWRGAKCRGRKGSQKCVCVTPELLGLMLVDWFFPTVFFPLTWVGAAVGWEGECVAEGGLWVPCTCAVSRPSLFSCAWETFPALEEHSILQSSNKDPERIPSDLGNAAISVFFTQRFVAVPCRPLLKRVVRHQLINWLFVFSGSPTLIFFCEQLPGEPSVILQVF